MSNKQEDFDAWLDENIILKQPFNCSKASYIKGALITTSEDLEKATNQRKDQQLSIPAKESLKPVIKRNIFKKEEDNKLRVDLKHLAHHTLLWIACVDDYCNIHEALKKKNHKYLVRMYWMLSELKYKNAKFMHRQHLTKEQ